MEEIDIFKINDDDKIVQYIWMVIHRDMDRFNNDTEYFNVHHISAKLIAWFLKHEHKFENYPSIIESVIISDSWPYL